MPQPPIDPKLGTKFYGGYIIYFGLDDESIGIMVNCHYEDEPLGTWRKVDNEQFGWNIEKQLYYFYESSLRIGELRNVKICTINKDGSTSDSIVMNYIIVEALPPLPVNDLIVEAGFKQFTADWRIGQNDIDPSISAVKAIIIEGEIENTANWKYITKNETEHEFLNDTFGNKLENGKLYNIYLRSVNPYGVQLEYAKAQVIPSASENPAPPIITHVLDARDHVIVYWNHNNPDSINEVQYRIRTKDHAYGSWRSLTSSVGIGYFRMRGMPGSRYILQMRAINNNGASKAIDSAVVIPSEF